MMQVIEGHDPYAGKAGDYRVRAMPAEAIGPSCGYSPCDDVALYYLETHDGTRFKGRRACAAHAEAWWAKHQEKPVKAKKAKAAPEPRKVGRPRSSEKRQRLHFTLGGLSLEILQNYHAQGQASGRDFNASRFVDEAIRFAHTLPEFREKIVALCLSARAEAS